MTSSDIYHEFEMEYGLAARERLLDATDSKHDKRVLVCRSARPYNTVRARCEVMFCETDERLIS